MPICVTHRIVLKPYGVIIRFGVNFHLHIEATKVPVDVIGQLEQLGFTVQQKD
jgi:hypothetical protein